MPDIMAKFSWILLFFASAFLMAGDWPQFRGPNASGVSGDTNLPVSFSPTENVVWKTAVPMGNSSPVVAVDLGFF